MAKKLIPGRWKPGRWIPDRYVDVPDPEPECSSEESSSWELPLFLRLLLFGAMIWLLIKLGGCVMSGLRAVDRFVSQHNIPAEHRPPTGPVALGNLKLQSGASVAINARWPEVSNVSVTNQSSIAHSGKAIIELRASTRMNDAGYPLGIVIASHVIGYIPPGQSKTVRFTGSMSGLQAGSTYFSELWLVEEQEGVRKPIAFAQGKSFTMPPPSALDRYVPNF